MIGLTFLLQSFSEVVIFRALMINHLSFVLLCDIGSPDVQCCLRVLLPTSRFRAARRQLARSHALWVGWLLDVALCESIRELEYAQKITEKSKNYEIIAVRKAIRLDSQN